jgi:hypothetical protein
MIIAVVAAATNSTPLWSFFPPTNPLCPLFIFLLFLSSTTYQCDRVIHVVKEIFKLHFDIEVWIEVLWVGGCLLACLLASFTELKLRTDLESHVCHTSFLCVFLPPQSHLVPLHTYLFSDNMRFNVILRVDFPC